MSEYLNEDDPTVSVTLPDGRVVKNLSAEEYAATYATGTLHMALNPDGELAGEAE